jgi:serine/threonine protein kinase
MSPDQDHPADPIRQPDGPPQVEPARLVGQYALIEKLGEGSGGIVWKAWDKKLLRWIAVKESKVASTKSSGRFLSEAQSGARLRHSSLIGVLDTFQHDGVDYIVMDYVESRPLDEVPLSHRELALLMADVCDAVEYMHSRGIIHRDIKPRNIFVDVDGKAHLGDFGLARILDQEHLTMEGYCVGTPQYMSPEQAAGQRSWITPQTDVYGLGVTLFRMLAGHDAYHDEIDLLPLLARIINKDIPSPVLTEPTIPSELKDIVRRAMAKKPAERTRSAGQLRDELRRFAGVETMAGGQRAPLAAKPWFQRPSVWAITAVLIAAGIAIHFTRDLPISNNGYSHARSITIDHAKVPHAAQNDFPVLIAGTYPFLANSANGGSVNDARGYDIALYADEAGSTPLKWEMESYNATNGEVAIWVKVPTLASATDTIIYLFYGNPSVTAFQSVAAGVWDADFKVVWHLHEASSAQAVDSTAAGQNSSFAATMQVAGKIGGGQSFDGSAHYLASTSNPVGSSPFTISAWAKYNVADFVIFDNRRASDSRGSAIILGHDGRMHSYNYPTNLTISGSPANLANGAWHHCAVTYDGTTLKMYADGASIYDAAYADASDQFGAVFHVAKSAIELGNTYYAGSQDELRISTSVRSAEWIATEYNNQSSPSSFYVIGPQISYSSRLSR